MKLSNLALSLAAFAVCSTAQAQVTSSLPIQQPQKAQPGVKQTPVKPIATKPVLTQQPQHFRPVAQTGTSFLGGGDNCATPDVITGTGSFAVDTTLATTGAEGQTEALCLAYATTGVTNDVWFSWTAPSSGNFNIGLCGGSSADTKLAVYPGATCPTAGTALACNDDFCGLQSQVSITATAGNSYMIQVGNYPGALGYSGTFTISTVGAGPANDNCSGATAIAGYGTFAVDTTSATGTTANGLCATANNDVWFAWTAPATGPAILSFCGLASVDTVAVVWPSCPPATALACNDDFCGLQSQLTFPATAGTTYYLELGSFSNVVTYLASFSIAAAPPPPADDNCATPTVLAGPGPYPFDTTASTTGVEGQAEALCAVQFGSSVISNDSWFTWTAPSSNLFRVSTCLQTGVDTKIAVYAGTGCPVSGSALACNDDDCNFQSGAIFTATAGSSYTIQLGSFPNALGGTGTFDISVFVPPPGDDCATPVALVGAGPYNYDNTSATTGAQGQAEPACLFYGSTAIDKDLWFCWTAPSTGAFAVSTIGLATSDTKLAVYDGCGCPATAALGCNDDACGTLQSSVTFNAVAGNSYTIQIGAFPGAQGAPGAFSIGAPPPPPSGCTYDDGSTENSIGLTAGGRLMWMHAFGQIGQSTTITDVSTAYGTAAFPGVAPANGTPTDIVIWDDSDDDGNPTTGLVLLGTYASTVQNVDTDILNSTPIAPAVTVNGVFFVGVAVSHIAGNYPSPLDQSSVICGGPDLSWIVGDTTGILDYNNLNAANVPPQSMNAIGFGGVWLLRAGCNLEPGNGYCFGDGTTTTPCPCANFGAAGNGCRSSFNANGAHITAHGVVAADNVVLDGSGMNPTGNCIFLKGDTNDPNGIVFGDGVRCATGALIRLRTVPLAGGAASFPDSTQTITLSARGGTPVGSAITAYYTVYYRNAASLFCPPETFNAANGYQITW